MDALSARLDELAARQLANRQSSDVTARIDELQAEVGRLQADLRHLYDRLGQPYPHGLSDSKQKRRKSGA
jgi:uncharacterized coiled-coil protein SlyX